VNTRAIAAATRRKLYYGWVVVGTLATTETISWGILYYAFAAFLVPMQQELGWSTAALTGAYSLALLVSGLAAVPVGRWVDRHGPRLLMTLGSIGLPPRSTSQPSRSLPRGFTATVGAPCSSSPSSLVSPAPSSCRWRPRSSSNWGGVRHSSCSPYSWP
jgi:MFS family permease